MELLYSVILKLRYLMSNPILTAMSHRTLPYNYEYNSKEVRYKNPLTTIPSFLS